MEPVKDLVERWAQALCDWLNDTFSDRRGFAALGHGITGLPSNLTLLPIDRRLGPSVMQMAPHDNMVTMNSASHVRKGLTDPKKCSFWGYCYMNGQPCVWCKGDNSLDQPDEKNPSKDFSKVGAKACPPGKTVGVFWLGCCQNPKGELRSIAFLDCCGTGFCVFVTKRCNNWADAKDWCAWTNDKNEYETDTTGARSYYCTVATDIGPCA